MTKLIIIAGPQSSGKTTIFNHLEKNFSTFQFLEEINPYTLIAKNHSGGAFINKDLELKLINADFQVLINLNRRLLNYSKPIIMETGIFHLVYAEKFCGKKIANNFFYKYLTYHEKFDCKTIFFDTKPEISWHRRYPNYLKRIKDQNRENNSFYILAKYQKTIYDLYPLWLKWYQKIPFEKVMIKNSFKTKKKFLQEVEEKIQEFLEK